MASCHARADSPKGDSHEVSCQEPSQHVGIAGESFVTALANVLTHLASLAGRPQRVTRFHAIRAPQLSVHDYLMRISTYFQCSDECFVLGLVYIDRIVKLHPEFTISNLNIHRLLVTSVMLAAKFFDDVYYSNSYYAKVGGVRTQELNALEALFLRLIEWRLHVLPEEYDSYRLHVLTAVSGKTPVSEGFGLTPPYQQAAPETPWRPALSEQLVTVATSDTGNPEGEGKPVRGPGDVMLAATRGVVDKRSASVVASSVASAAAAASAHPAVVPATA
eukprot:CAMPEP_0117515044 /NCGR_PEP_ID=MMETSP0784-20121206/30378_1 /TAXON_ID=39447 /ORGANISM="" /LENGTH=275 /DNA_ID=CAMNT_0005310851 /DNA_START=95 /DNA_END=922 /DNA_ORIENTATION=+